MWQLIDSSSLGRHGLLHVQEPLMLDILGPKSRYFCCKPTSLALIANASIKESDCLKMHVLS